MKLFPVVACALLSVAAFGAACTTPLQYEPLPACGVCNGDDCCRSALIPGGTFSRGFDRSGVAMQDDSPVVGWQPEKMATATLSSYRLDIYEVTVHRFRAFVEDYSAWRNSGEPQKDEGAVPGNVGGWDSQQWSALLPASENALRESIGSCQFGSWTDAPADNEQNPMDCVSWYEAFLFCIWAGGRLPSEAEWNYAAAGGDWQRAFPWSDPADAIAVQGDEAVFGHATSTSSVAKVGSIHGFDARWGHRDLAGNVFEWVMDHCADCAALDATPSLDTYEDPCDDCVQIGGNARMFRGGSWKHDAKFMRTAYRAGTSAAFRYYDLGFRCAQNN